VRLASLGTYVQTQHDDHEDVVGQGFIDLVHDQDLVISETRLSLDLGLTRRFGASLVFPFRVVSTSIRYLDTSGMEVDLVTEGIHHRNETVTGLADPLVMGSVAGALGSFRGVARAGFSIPIGRTERDPFAPDRIDTPHQHIQLGTGTVNPMLSAELTRRWGRWHAGAFVLTQQVVYENSKGYHAGDRYAGGLTVRRSLGATWGVRGGAEVQAETAERWGGVVHTDDGNRGRLDAMLAVGVSVAATEALSIDLALKIPVVSHVVGGQLDMPAIVELGVAWSFGGSPAHEAEEDHDHGDEHDHDHEGEEHEEPGDHHDDHGPVVHPDATGLDVVDLGPPGAAPALVPVPGKLTIFDFWAPWCEPCKKLDPALVEIARAHPATVAIRRIDVVDWDSAAAATYLTPGGFNLPHLKVYGPDGALVLERSSGASTLQALIDAVRALAERPVPAPPR